MEWVDCMFDNLATTSLTYKDTTKRCCLVLWFGSCPWDVSIVFADPLAVAVSSMLLVILYSILLTPGRRTC